MAILPYLLWEGSRIWNLLKKRGESYAVIAKLKLPMSLTTLGSAESSLSNSILTRTKL